MSAPPSVTLCIINFNGAMHLRNAFQAFRNQDYQFAEILLIDNASDDSSLEVARELCEEARQVKLERNLGPGAARNAGFRLATNDLILFQDNDIRLGKDTARLLLRNLDRHPDALLVAPRVLYAHDPDTVQYGSADCHFLGLMATRNANRRAEDLDTIAVGTTTMVSACFLINRGCWSGEELFDESFGFNLEDHDFGVRACLSGHSLLVEPLACVQHGSGTPALSFRQGQTPARDRLYYLTLNRWVVVSKCFATRTIAILSPGFLLYELLQLAWLAGHGHFFIWTSAISSYWRSRKRIGAARRSIQSRRQIADRNVLRDAQLPLTGAVRCAAGPSPEHSSPWSISCCGPTGDSFAAGFRRRTVCES